MEKNERKAISKRLEPLSELNLSTRVYDIFVDAGYTTIREIYDLSYKQLKSIKGIDANSINEILCKIHLFERGMTQEKLFKADVSQLWNECKEQRSFEPLNCDRTIRGKNIRDSKLRLEVFLILFQKYINYVDNRINENETPLGLQGFVRTFIVKDYAKYKWVLKLHRDNDVVKRTIASMETVKRYKSEQAARQRNVKNRRLEYETRPSKLFATV